MDKSLGPDQVHPRTLLEAVEESAEDLVEIFTSALAIGEVPEIRGWLMLYFYLRKCSKNKPRNYRPVSLMTT